MAGESFRFLHASNLHLDQPLAGLTEIPDHLQEALLQAPYVAAERVFQAAIREEVDFVALSGDVLDASRCGPRGLAFLHDQLSLMNEHRIPVFWSASHSDLIGTWVSEANLPKNVQIFSTSTVEEFPVMRGDHRIATVIGRSWNGQATIRASEFRHDPTDDFLVVVAYGNSELEGLFREGTDYWALGGARQARTLGSGRGMAHYPGSPQGFSTADTGPRGCTLVNVDGAGEVRLRFIETDSVRWLQERVKVRDSATREDVRAALQTQMRQLQASSGGRVLLISWELAGLRRWGGHRHGGLTEEVLSWLRGEWGYSKPPVWTLSLELDNSESLPSDWSEEDSLLGDFLRTLKAFEEQPEKHLALESYLADRHPASDFVRRVDLTDEATRSRVLREAASLGVELLRGDDNWSWDQKPGAAGKRG